MRRGQCVSDLGGAVERGPQAGSARPASAPRHTPCLSHTPATDFLKKTRRPLRFFTPFAAFQAGDSRRMKLGTVTVILALAVRAAGGQVARGPVQELMVCVAGDLPPRILPLAQGIATRMFGGIGVKVSWRHLPADCEGQRPPAILVLFGESPAKGLRRNTLGRARPRERTVLIANMRFWRDEGKPFLARQLLAHVLVHEIAHILQGAERHSETGIMKAGWTQPDFDQMAFEPLGFEPQDVLLIRSGLARWAEQSQGTLAAKNRRRAVERR
jgi:hypothetical protein